MPAVIDATIGGSSANSYVTLAEADAYAANQQWEATWLAFTDDQRNAALITATSWLQTLDWSGTKCNPASDDVTLRQRLDWPRSGVTCEGTTASCTMIPWEVQTAQVELAFQFAQDPNLILGSTGGSTPGPVKRQKLDVLEVEYYEGGAGASIGSGNLLTQVPWLANWLGCWYGNGTRGQVRLYRN
jgi:hypothetical protein